MTEPTYEVPNVTPEAVSGFGDEHLGANRVNPRPHSTLVGSQRPTEAGESVRGEPAQGTEPGVGEVSGGNADEASKQLGSQGYNPDDYTVDEVNKHLTKVDDAERDRIIAAERAGQNRSTIKGVTQD